MIEKTHTIGGKCPVGVTEYPFSFALTPLDVSVRNNNSSLNQTIRHADAHTKIHTDTCTHAHTHTHTHTHS
jgi:hypothetical protein